jgi:hypothetical protein
MAVGQCLSINGFLPDLCVLLKNNLITYKTQPATREPGDVVALSGVFQKSHFTDLKTEITTLFHLCSFSIERSG